MSLLHELTVATGFAAPDLVRIIASAPKRYKVYGIPKKHGGTRIIAQPSRELKVLQRFLLKQYLSKYPIHPAAMAYVIGRNIFENAERHSKSSVFLKMDFQDFFPSIKASDWRRFLKEDRHSVFASDEISIVTRILFWGSGSSEPKCLSIGAPTSPILSNILLFDLDTNISNLADQSGVCYTRYADDITISAHSMDSVLTFEKQLRREIDQLRFPKLKFNQKKRGIYHKGQRRMVTGLVVTPAGQISIGRERKRFISVLLHKFSIGELSIERTGILKGLLGFTIANEPAFVDRMRLKYGDQIINGVLTTYIPSRI